MVDVSPQTANEDQQVPSAAPSFNTAVKIFGRGKPNNNSEQEKGDISITKRGKLTQGNH